MKIPDRIEAENLLAEAQVRNPGPWVEHSRHTARAAQALAAHHPELDACNAYVLGLLHDIGRRFGMTDMRHVLDGYHYLLGLGYESAARISLTHSYPLKTRPAEQANGTAAWQNTLSSQPIWRESAIPRMTG